MAVEQSAKGADIAVVPSAPLPFASVLNCGGNHIPYGGHVGHEMGKPKFTS